MATNPFSLPSSYQQELTGIDRRRQLAQSLLQNSMQPQQGQMVSGHYVSPGIAGGMGQILGAYLANKGINTADQQEKMVTDRYNTDRNKVLAEALQAREGVPAQTIDNPQPEGVDHAGTVQAAVPGSNKKMAEILAGSQFPELQQMGMTQLFKGPDKPIILGRTAIDNNGKVIAVDSTWQEEQKAAREAKQADLEARLEDQRLSRQDRAELQKQLAQMNIDARRDIASQSNALRRDLAQQRQPQNKPIPATALKMQQEELDAIGGASGINADLGAVSNQLKQGALKLGPMENLKSQARNLSGQSTENSRNYANLSATLERLRNESLRLNKGVQTEGDSIRAWNELITNLNDPELVKSRIEAIQNINNRAVQLRKMNIDNIRTNYGYDPLDTSGYSNVSPALNNPPPRRGGGASGSWGEPQAPSGFKYLGKEK